jgi:hypothetical protein
MGSGTLIVCGDWRCAFNGRHIRAKPAKNVVSPVLSQAHQHVCLLETVERAKFNGNPRGNASCHFLKAFTLKPIFFLLAFLIQDETLYV